VGKFLMPSLGSDMESGTLVEWEKNPGDAICRGDVLAVVETQKGAIEIEAFENGILTKQLIEIGTAVPVGTPLAVIDSVTSSTKVDTEAAVESVYTNPSTQSVDTEVEPSIHESVDLAVSAARTKEVDSAVGVTADTNKHASEQSLLENASTNRIRITPAARALAENLGLAIDTLAGSGPSGAIVLDDVCRFSSVKGEFAQPLEAMRTAIAAAMTRSKKEIPHYYLAHTIHISAAKAWLEYFNAQRDASQRILLGVLLLKAVALACEKFGEFNGYYTDGRFQPSDHVHAGMAINLRGGGLVAPAIHNTHELNIDQLMECMLDLVKRVRAGRFRAAELSDPTITVSSLGDRGVNSLIGIIYPPQVAIVGFGTPVIRPLVDDNGDIHAGTFIDVTLAADHRVSDGHRGALFLRFIQKQLEHPESLVS